MILAGGGTARSRSPLSSVFEGSRNDAVTFSCDVIAHEENSRCAILEGFGRDARPAARTSCTPDRHFRQLHRLPLFGSSLRSSSLDDRISRRDTKGGSEAAPIVGPKCANVVVRVLATTRILGLKQELILIERSAVIGHVSKLFRIAAFSGLLAHALPALAQGGDSAAAEKLFRDGATALEAR